MNVNRLKQQELRAREERIEKMRSDIRKILVSKYRRVQDNGYYKESDVEKVIDALIDMIEKGNDEILTIEEVARFIKFPKSYVYKNYNMWRDYGLRILSTHPNARPRFWKSDIVKVLEAWK